jgi:hypothetical protein
MRKVPVPVTAASYSPFFVCLIDLFFVFEDLGFFVFRLFFNYLSQESSIVVAGTDPVMSSEAQGGLPQA